jgi:hypothetical protein
MRTNRRILIGGVILAAVVGVAFAGLAVAGAGPFGPNPRQGTPRYSQGVPLPSAAQVDLLRNVMRSEAHAAGEDHPSNGVLVVTRRAPFNEGSIPDKYDEDVYVVAASGQFTLDVPTPPGAPLPQGSFLWMAFRASAINPDDPQSLELLDRGLEYTPKDLSKFGPSIPLDLG